MSTKKTTLGKAAASTINRAPIIDANFRHFLDSWSDDEQQTDRFTGDLAENDLLDLFESQLLSRHLDIEARAMRARNQGFYTIGSSGHEANAALARVARITDPAFLHYRSGAFMMERSRKDPAIDPVYAAALSLTASAEDPISGGRHKVWGSKALWVPPQTSTIASHLPKALGTAMAIEQCRRLRHPLPIPDDSIVICSFGDASANHATAQTAFNAAEWMQFQKLPVPIIFLCEDNGIGISVKTPKGWIADRFSNHRGLHYLYADGLDIKQSFQVSRQAVDYCRQKRQAVFLHLRTIRLMAHAGTDFEAGYRPLEEIEAAEADDPLKHTAIQILRRRIKSTNQLRELYDSVAERVQKAAKKAEKRPKLTERQEICAPLNKLNIAKVAAEASRADYTVKRAEVFTGGLPEEEAPKHLAVQINRALFDLMAKYPNALIFGEDVAKKGGVYTVTSGLFKQFGASRVFNTLLDETTILGFAQGAGLMGLLPIPEIQYLAYFHNAGDQVRGEACSLAYFSQGQFRNPMLIRIASLAYQRGFGGHFHNDNSFTALRDIPDLIIACPCRGDDAVKMLRTALALNHVHGRVVAFLEPIALYMTRDLYEEKDKAWCFPYPPPNEVIPLDECGIYHESAEDLLILSYGNGVPMSLRVARRLAEENGIHTRILDIRWLKPLPVESILRHSVEFEKVLVVDEGRRTAGISEELFTLLDEYGQSTLRKRRVTAEDAYIPLAEAANLILASEDDIYKAAVELVFN